MARFLKRRLSLILLAVLVSLWLYPEFFGLHGGEARTVTGNKVIVRDGDTLTLGTQDFRLHGIDAPEFSQTCKDKGGHDWACGTMARLALLDMVAGQILSCEERAKDKYQRVVATCKDAQGNDIGRAMIVKGMAISFGGFTDGPYSDEEAEARRVQIGIWQGPFQVPQDWRAAHPHTKTP